MPAPPTSPWISIRKTIAIPLSIRPPISARRGPQSPTAFPEHVQLRPHHHRGSVPKGLLYLGTENALYVSFDDGRNWQPLQMNLPHAPVYGMTVQKHFHDLVLATYGRGFWILDDITPLEQLTPEVLGSTAYLFPPRDAYRFRAVTEPTAFSYDPTAGQNAAYGADINYFLKSSPQGDVHIIIQDAAGHTVRTLPGSKQVGINRIWWDLRFERTREIRLRTSPPYAPYIHVGPDGWRPMPYNSQDFSARATRNLHGEAPG